MTPLPGAGVTGAGKDAATNAANHEDAREALVSEINDLTAQVAQKDERIAELEKFKITTDISDKVGDMI